MVMMGPVCWFAVLLLVGLCSSVPAGRDFATSFMQNLHGDGQDTHLRIKVSALPASRGSTKVKVTAVGKVYKQEVEPGKSVSFELPNNVEMKGSGKFRTTVLIEASQDVTVMSLNYQQNSTDTSIVYPVGDWGTEYYIFTPASYLQGSFKEFSITNHKDPNYIDVFLRGSVTFQDKPYRAGSKLTMKLEPFESVQIQSQEDLSGTKVVSYSPVAVSSGHSCAEMYTTCSHVYEQLLPVASWGQEFVIAPLPLHSTQGHHDSVYIQASQPTEVTMNIDGKVQNFKMAAGQTSELYSEWPQPIYLTSSQGIQVLFEFNGGPENLLLSYGPFLMTILPTSQFSISYSLEVQEGFSSGLILVARTEDLGGLTLDQTALSADIQWNRVDGSDYSWTELYHKPGASLHQLAHPKSPFGVYNLGFAMDNGYGSPASSDLAVRRDCSTIKCQRDQECQMTDNIPECVKKPPVVRPGTCWAMGDPHYRTFDGHYFNFMGNCTYTMAKNCDIDGAHPAFEVEAQNENRAGSKITYVGKVIIKVYGYTVIIVRSEVGFVRMDYTLWNLPIFLGDGKVTLSQSGLSVVLETDFGLMVQYDWEQYLTITVAGTFAGKVCGLCGNFNTKKEDDLVTPSGSVAENIVALGTSWRVPNATGDAFCQDKCTGQCESCKREGIFSGLADRMFCSFLTHVMDGPFRDCHAIIEPKVYHENCLYDVCMGDGMKKFLCNSLQVYADSCQRAGIKIYNWRHFARCPAPTCPENSHYEACGVACPATCHNPEAASRCRSSCVETCVCDEGFLLSGTKCVPKDQCGCMYKGYYVEAGEAFWADGNCTEWCQCDAKTKDIVCQHTGCQNGHECKVVDGLLGCHPKAYAKCTVSGDPHYMTFDSLSYSFQGTCVYQMAGVCSKNPKLEHFDVLVQNDGRGKRMGSSAKLVEVNVYGYSVVISKEHKGSILVNTELTNVPVSLDRGKITVQRVGDFAEIKTDFGLHVSYDWLSTVIITVPNSYTEKMCGLCGNYNFNPKDDMQMKDGKLTTSADELGKSWRVAEIPGCVDGCKDKNQCPNCDITQKQKFETNEYCGEIRDPDGPFRRCHAVINPDSYFETCVYDVCLNDGNKDSWCNSLRTYTILCQQAGVEVDQWRRNDFCPISSVRHVPHSHYEHCGSVCQATCDSGMPPSKCEKPCQEGWVCDDGYLLSGDNCVPFGECGCVHSGKYHKYGEVFHPNGLCKDECICNGTIQAACTKFNCGPHEKCEVKNGIRSCHPFGNGMCTIAGDPHYKTFDNSYYDFQGTCTYTAAKGCHLEGTHLQAFSVVVENERWPNMPGNPDVSVAKLVAVEVYGYTLILRINQIGMIMLNGIMKTIPLNIDEGKVQVYLEGTHYVILTDFGLRVTYDMIYRITVTVPGNYRGKTCGLCGNFNDDKADEFQLPDGQVSKDIKTFGAAWKVPVQGVVCDNGCSGDICPKCDLARKAVFEKDCEIITRTNGPFAACHNVINPTSYYRDCVYDTCLSKGDSDVLCNSIQAYVNDCQFFGVKLSNWRTSQFCPLSCSTNSHYEICAETCDAPCPGLTDLITCPTTCAEGCVCNDGYYFNGTGCVVRDECSCYFNGQTYKIGESVLSSECEQRCTCMASGQVKCEDTKCGMAERCQVKGGIRGCYPKECVMDTGGSIILFDGKAGILTAPVAYNLIENCNVSTGVEWFRVVVQLQECGLTGVRHISAIYTFFSDVVITLTDRHEAWVNGKTVNLPVQPRSDISLVVSEKTLVIEKKSGFRLSYSFSQQVTVTMNDNMVGELCGLCGTLAPRKDHQGLSEETIQEYGAAFTAQDFPTCAL